jgi:hypothetical protein
MQLAIQPEKPGSQAARQGKRDRPDRPEVATTFGQPREAEIGSDGNFSLDGRAAFQVSRLQGFPRPRNASHQKARNRPALSRSWDEI